MLRSKLPTHFLKPLGFLAFVAHAHGQDVMVSLSADSPGQAQCGLQSPTPKPLINIPFLSGWNNTDDSCEGYADDETLGLISQVPT